jgi:hypothetical protein
MKRYSPTLAALLLALFAPTAADAHLVNSGLGPIYDGALHLVLSPMDVVRLIALCLFVGLQGPVAARGAVIVVPIAWLLSSAIALSIDATGPFDLLNGASLFLLGAGVAFDMRLPPLVTGVTAAAFAGLIGFQNGSELRIDSVGWEALLGGTAVASAIILIVTSLFVLATAFPARVACRVLGSWASATGLLSIGWIFAAGR